MNELLTKDIGHTDDNRVPEEWSSEKLGDVSSIFFSNVDKKSDSDEIPVTLCNYMDVYQNSYIKKDIKFMEATATQSEIDKFSLKHDDVIITKDSETPQDIAVAAHVADKLTGVICGYHLALIRSDKSKLDGQYLSQVFSLNSVQRYFSCLANGSTRFGLTVDSIVNTELSIPPLPEQKKIASILTAVDEVIENTQKQIDKLQDLKKAIMNELLTKGIGHTEFKGSELGRIPKSWEVKSIGELGNVVTGSTPSTTNRKLYDGQYMFVSPADISENMFVLKTGKTLSLIGLENTRRIPRNSIMVVCIGSTIGKVSMSTENCATNQQINTIISKDNDPYFIYFAMKWMASSIKKAAGTQAVPMINKTNFSSLFAPVPPKDEQQRIGRALHSLNVGIEKLCSKLHQIQSLKKALMQDLLTGKVRVIA